VLKKTIKKGSMSTEGRGKLKVVIKLGQCQLKVNVNWNSWKTELPYWSSRSI